MEPPAGAVWEGFGLNGRPLISTRLVTFAGGSMGPWRIVSMEAVVGEPLPIASRLDVVIGMGEAGAETKWVLRGTTSNERYTTRAEKDALMATQVALGRGEATCSALIPIKKSDAWWALPQDERRAILEERSRHVETGLRYLPAIARRLHHCRDLGEAQPFDFLTLFDYSPADASAFEDLVGELRCTEEWKFVEREVDIRLVR